MIYFDYNRNPTDMSTIDKIVQPNVKAVLKMLSVI